MSRTRRDLDYLADIQEAIHRILAYTQGMTWDDFLEDHRTQDDLPALLPQIQSVLDEIG